VALVAGLAERRLEGAHDAAVAEGAQPFAHLQRDVTREASAEVGPASMAHPRVRPRPSTGTGEGTAPSEERKLRVVLHTPGSVYLGPCRVKWKSQAMATFAVDRRRWEQESIQCRRCAESTPRAARSRPSELPSIQTFFSSRVRLRLGQRAAPRRGWSGSESHRYPHEARRSPTSSGDRAGGVDGASPKCWGVPSSAGDGDAAGC
jgi:hypothetical protein